jgi:hypothetical protein
MNIQKKIRLSIFNSVTGLCFFLFSGSDVWANNGLTLNFDSTYKWATGFEVTVTIRNSGPTVESWRLEFDLPHSIEGTSNAILEERNGDHYILTGLERDPSIPSKGSITFWFVANLEPDHSQFPRNCRLNKEPCQFEGSSQVANTEVNSMVVPEAEALGSDTDIKTVSKVNRLISPWESKFLNLVPSFRGVFSQ